MPAGSASFREGVDVPGDGLTQVIIDRIPFLIREIPFGAGKECALKEQGRLSA